MQHIHKTPFDTGYKERQRLAELERYRILGTPPEVVFDRLAKLAAHHFNMPIALVSLVDETRQWFKARHGIDAPQTPRDIAFCAHVIQGTEVMVVADTIDDARFAKNPLVTGDPNIRFYAGAPLMTRDGHALGTVCVIDRVPHPEFGEAQEQELAAFAAIAIDEMELRLAVQHATHDLSALKATQQALDEERARAERAMHEKSQFIASISHELRTPMNGILGMAYLLGDTPLNPQQREYIDTINHSAKNLLLLVNDVLDLSKIEAKELILERTAFDVRTSFIQTIKLLQPLAQKRGNHLRYDVDVRVPSLIVGDPGRFAQIVTNLIGNAVKFTENGSVEANLHYRAADETIFCEILDTGIGIPEQKHHLIFEKFVQGDAAITQKYGGTGLGLAITKQLATMLGGTIGFESRVGTGSRFWFALPATPPRDESQQPFRAAVLTANPEAIPAHTAQVLIAEDNPVNQMFLVALLKKFGFTRIDVAENGLEAMEKLAAHSPPSRAYDAIFMDCMMPEQDGYETTRRIRQQEAASGAVKPIPIIAMTANALTGDREACFAAGMDAYVSKPLQPEKLKEMLCRWFAFPEPAGASSIRTTDTSSATPPLEMERLRMVAETSEEQAAVLTLFFQLANQFTETMTNARRAEEFAAWKGAAHSLKGSAGNLGMKALEERCRQAEKAAEASYEQRTTLLELLREELARVRAYAAQQQLLPKG